MLMRSIVAFGIRRLSLTLVLAGLATSCRSVHTVQLADWLEAKVAVPPAGIMQLPYATEVIYRDRRGRTRVVFSGSRVTTLNWDDEAVALRDDSTGRLVVVTRAGVVSDVRALGCKGMTIAPPVVAAIDCWQQSAASLSFLRVSPSGEIIRRYGTPAWATECQATEVDFLGYDAAGEPLVGYDCAQNGARVCRAGNLRDGPLPGLESKANERGAQCGYVLREEHKVLSRATDGVRVWGGASG